MLYRQDIMMFAMFCVVVVTLIWACAATACAFKYWDEVGDWRSRYYRLRRRCYRREKTHDTTRGNYPGLFAEYNGHRSTDEQTHTGDVGGESDEGR